MEVGRSRYRPWPRRGSSASLLGNRGGRWGGGSALVRSDGEVLGGFVMAGSSERGEFEAADEMMAGTLAAHVTVALQNRQHVWNRNSRWPRYLQRAMLPRAACIPGPELDVTHESASEAALVGGDF